jgi:hypothetical protein
MNNENKLVDAAPVQTEFAWTDASRVESALAEPTAAESAVIAVPVESAQAEVSDPAAATASVAESATPALPEPSQPEVSDPTSESARPLPSRNPQRPLPLPRIPRRSVPFPSAA